MFDIAVKSRKIKIKNEYTLDVHDTTIYLFVYEKYIPTYSKCVQKFSFPRIFSLFYFLNRFPLSRWAFCYVILLFQNGFRRLFFDIHTKHSN